MITSKENALIKKVKSLSQKKYRDEYGQYVVEGVKICDEAIKFAKVEVLIVCTELLGDFDESKYSKVKVEQVSKSVFLHISDTKTPQGMLAVIDIPEPKKVSDTVVFALDNIQDPGNLGTIIRSLDAFGYKDLIISDNTVDPYNSKVVRSTMGSILRLNIKSVDLLNELSGFKKSGYKIVVTSLDTNQYIYDINFSEKQIIVIGNEANGVSKEIQKLADLKVKIPMKGKAESLNAAVATSIIAYEKIRK